MMMSPDRIAVIVGAVLAIILQMALAPYIAIGSAIPNIVAAYAFVVAVSRPHTYGALMPFLMGLVYDLATGGPVGSMAFCLTLLSCVAARMFASLDNDTLFMPLAILAAGLLALEIVYGLFLISFGYGVGFFEALVYRMLPCFVYDLVIGIILYLFVGRFFKQTVSIHHDITQLR